MNDSMTNREETNVNKSDDGAHPRLKGFVYFCETKLRYEKGIKAWAFVGAYLLGALGLELIISGHTEAATNLGPWLGFIAYLIFFPPTWRRIFKLAAWRKAVPVAHPGSSALELPSN